MNPFQTAYENFPIGAMNLIQNFNFREFFVAFFGNQISPLVHGQTVNKKLKLMQDLFFFSIYIHCRTQ